jgi:hypothetical protein
VPREQEIVQPGEANDALSPGCCADGSGAAHPGYKQKATPESPNHSNPMTFSPAPMVLLAPQIRLKVFPKSNGFDSRGNTVASGQRELNILNEAQRSAAQPEEQPPAK